MNDFLQLQNGNMSGYIYASLAVGAIGVVVAGLIALFKIHVNGQRRTIGYRGIIASNGEICFWSFFLTGMVTAMVVLCVLFSGYGSSNDKAYDMNMQAIQSAYNIRDVRQNARTSGDALHTTVQDGRNSEQNTTSIREVLSGDEDGSAAVTAISNGSDSLGHYIFRVDDNHRLRVYQDTKDGTHLITPAVQNHASANGATVQSSIR